MLTVLRNLSAIVNIVNSETSKLWFDDSDRIEITIAGTGSKLAVVADHEGNIADFGDESTVCQKYSSFNRSFDCNGGCVLPGFVDGHTHPVWAGDRIEEFCLKLKGASYMEIHESGGGIHFTVNKTTEADEGTLYAHLKERLKSMVRKGTTTIECKSGYGLRWPAELKLLRVLTRAKRELPLDLSLTYLAAHAVPKESNAEDFSKHIVLHQIPALRASIQNGEIEVDNIDVFCEEGVYNAEQTKRILSAGRDIGLNINFHADEINHTGGAELAGALRARAASHLEEATPLGVAAMAASGTAAVLLPTTAHLLRLRPPPARAIIQAGVPVALGSDFNPNSYCLSMPLVMYLACTVLQMTTEEALAAATINSAYSLNLSHRIGAISIGRQADLVVLKCNRWEHIIYRLGEAESLITHVFKKGRLLFSQDEGFVGF